MKDFKKIILLSIVLFFGYCSSGTCSTNSSYQQCLSFQMGTTIFSNTITSQTTYLGFRAPVVPFHNNSCLMSSHIVVNDFEEHGYFNSKNRQSEIHLFDSVYNPAALDKCLYIFNFTNYLATTYNYFNFYFVQLIRCFLISWPVNTHREQFLWIIYYF